MSLAAVLIAAAVSAPAPKPFALASPGATATILVPRSEPECVRRAAADLAADVERITGRRPGVVAEAEGAAPHCVVLATVDRPDSAALCEKLAPGAADRLAGKWEAFRVQSVAARLGPVRRAVVIAGSDPRGTMFGTYAFCEEYLGVDPLHFWADRMPEKRERLAWDEVELEGGEPTFRYRGWFINDEDLLTEWHLDGGRRDIDYPFYSRVVSPKVSPHVFEAMLRLRYNLVIPASFVDIRNPDEARLVEEASRRGLFVSQHHIEPLGVSGFAFLSYWKEKGEDVPFSFVRHRDRFEHVWREYARRWAQYPNVVWQLGLRGIADRPMWVTDPAAPRTDAERGKLISEAMDLQWEIVKSVDRRRQPPATTTLWMEGAALHQKGHLTFPPGVAVIFADNSPGWQWQRDFYEVAREKGRPYGVYYHQALWGTGPHLAQAVSPWKMHDLLGQAVRRGSSHYAIFNVSNVREFVLGVEASARMTRDFASFDPDRFLSAWCRERFGPAAPEVEECYRRYFDSFAIDAEKGTRHLLDGETLHKGKRIYGLLTERLAEGKRPLLNDPGAVRRELARVGSQREALERSGRGAAGLASRMEAPARRLFQVNFLAQQQIMLGLVEWLGAGLEAGLAMHEGQRDEAPAALARAGQAWQRIDAAQALATRGPKWEHWYRGDRKMNLAAARRLTERLAEVLRTADEDEKGEGNR